MPDLAPIATLKRSSLWRQPSTGDLVAGVSVALVLVPQSVAYAVLAGIPPERGMVVGVVATIAAAPFLASPYLQSGPTAITSLLTLGTLSTLASPMSESYVALAALLALMVGAIRLGIALSQAGELAYFLSSPVLAGFTSAAAVVIVASQLPTLTGAPADADSVLVQTGQVMANVGEWNPVAVAIGLGTVAVVLLARRLSPLVPGVLIAIVAGVLIGQATATGDVAAETLGELPAATPVVSLALPWSRVTDLLVPALIIAVIGFSEAAAIARKFAAEERFAWDPDREFASQGVSNLAAGLVGGFPAGASFSRSALNHMAGATSAWSGLVTGLLMVGALPLVGLLADLPRAVLSGIIVAAVGRLADPGPVFALRTESRQQFTIALVTALATLLLAPQVHWAILIGIALSIAAHLRRERYITTEHWVEDGHLHLRPTGVLWFGSAPRFEEQATTLITGQEVTAMTIHLQRLGRTDVSGAYALRRIVELARDRGVTVDLTDPTEASRLIIERVMRTTGS
ncbi:SulP family inorganic anion transporter [Euzebya tangerina]|uniref:SulP family inorganic anion transporter n=1 Tax=Euzebya tangerina TaxID=591198 RepID=UPI0013C37171|nr:SulP family inorganic anion transporter [Euzebya tangerina]